MGRTIWRGALRATGPVLTLPALHNLREEADLVPRGLPVVRRALLHLQSTVRALQVVSDEPHGTEVAPAQLPEHFVASILEMIPNLRRDRNKIA